MEARAMTHDQITGAVRIAPQYDSPDAFCSSMLPLMDATQANDLRKIWIAVAAPFRDFLAKFGLTQAELSRKFSIPLRTIQDWAGERRSCPIYLRKMMATLLILDNAMQDVAPLNNEQIENIIDLYNRSEAKGAAALTEMDSDNAKISARGDENFAMAYSEMDAIDRMLRILGYKIITGDGSDEAIDIKRIDYDHEYDREINGYDRGNWSGLKSDN
jgi:hypothetical protein